MIAREQTNTGKKLVIAYEIWAQPIPVQMVQGKSGSFTGWLDIQL
jgi:hypothetical protein